MFSYHANDKLHVEKVYLLVKNMRNSLTFYQNILGFEVIGFDKSTALLGTKTNGFIHLTEDQNALEASVTLGLYHFALLVPERKDLAYFLNRLKNARYPITGASDHGVSEAIYLDDPDGNGIEIYRDRDVSEWPLLNGNLDMYTKRLDLQALLNEFNPNRDELPQDTLLGHLHLHVDDLESTETFFVNCLGFKKTMLYQKSALFIADGGYHHHLGLNTWQKGSPLCALRQVGLKSYDLAIPEAEYQGLIHRIHELHIPIFTDESQTYIIDPLQHRVYLRVKQSL